MHQLMKDDLNMLVLTCVVDIFERRNRSEISEERIENLTALMVNYSVFFQLCFYKSALTQAQVKSRCNC